MSYTQKYLKYKTKYLQLKKLIGGINESQARNTPLPTHKIVNVTTTDERIQNAEIQFENYNNIQIENENDGSHTNYNSIQFVDDDGLHFTNNNSNNVVSELRNIISVGNNQGDIHHNNDVLRKVMINATVTSNTEGVNNPILFNLVNPMGYVLYCSPNNQCYVRLFDSYFINNGVGVGITVMVNKNLLSYI